MDTVRLYFKHGPQTITIRSRKETPFGSEPTKETVVWDFDNSFKAAVPLWWWNSIQNEYFLREDHLRYRDVFIPL